MAFHPGKFAWFEHLSNDTEKSRQFYEQLMGWKVKSFAPGTYEVIHNGGDFIGGVAAAEGGDAAHWRSWLSVPDVDDRYAAALKAGGKPVMPPRDFPGAGRGATVLDPTGARVSLWKGTQGDRPDAESVKHGDFDWNELSTPDPQKALAFYESVFGYQHRDMELGELGTYHLLTDSNGVPRGGIQKTNSASDPALWVPYVKVEDATGTAARVAPLGGKLLLEPQPVPGVGRVGMLADPFGAMLGFMQPEVKA